MVIPFDTGDAPLTAIWAIHEDDAKAPQNAPWRTIVAHWSKIDYAAEKKKGPGTHPQPDFMGDVVDPRSTQKFPGNLLLNATVEGRLLETNFQEKPWKQDSKMTGDKIQFMIDSDAKEGDMPKYAQGQRAFLCGFASHAPPSGKGSELIKPIYRDDFCTWGHIEEGGKRWKILPMYFIPHGGGIEALCQNVSKYKFNASKGPHIAARMAQKVPELVSSDLVVSEENPQGDGDAAKTNGDVDPDSVVVGGGDIKFDTPEEEPADDEAVDATEDALLKEPLKEANFGEEAERADEAAVEHGDDW
ncbi:uncharacterized protein LY89DRAFT_732158 [Mollisia scopiformis]|uniref:Uncharacterized protein n=1 Tax=Mollisia scopiformis TaxID=149040 RepID=A0A194XEK4_MOLSC|nr:uncharacterized protein LY89DRAFT_732158 [Mollisia scopiformis]KUJ18603.1 hypothetical protein LY89DRAFT_732158 [Mollisia scopiformis]